MLSDLNLFKPSSFDSPEARECLLMILLVEQNDSKFSTQLSDNFRNLLLSVKQVHLKHTDRLVEEVLDRLITTVQAFGSKHVQFPAMGKANKEVFKHLSKCVGLYCQE